MRHAAAPYRAQLEQARSEAVAQLELSHARMLVPIRRSLATLYREVNTLPADIPIPPSWIHEKQRLAGIQHMVGQQVAHYATIAQMTTAHVQQQAQALGVTAAHAQIQQAVPRSDTTYKRVAAVVLASLITREAVTSLFAMYSSNAVAAVTSALLVGLSLDSSVEWIDRAIQTALDASRWQSITALITAMYDAYNSATLETYRANSDLVTGWIWICQLIGSCSACIAMHGSLHSLDEDLLDHPHGGCEMEPITASTDAIQSGADWFDEQDTALQEQVLGPGKFALYQAGDITLADLAGVRDDGRIYEKPLKAL